MEAHPRLAAAGALAAVLAGLCLLFCISGLSSGPFPCVTCLIGAADAGAALFIGLVLRLMTRASLTDMKTLANIEDENRDTSLIIGSFVATATLFAVFGELRGLAQQDALSAGVHACIAIATIILAWIFMNCMFTLHYAHEYYRDASPQRPRGGLIFPGRNEPDYWDFLYFSFVIGMTFQVSDIQIEDRGLRRLVLFHGLLAFLFNVLVLSLTINIVSSLISSKPWQALTTIRRHCCLGSTALYRKRLFERVRFHLLATSNSIHTAAEPWPRSLS
jgi:uncharacterized membrane protein